MRYLLFILISLSLLVGCGDGSRDTGHQEMNEQIERNVLDSSSVREANTDVASLDQNGDGMVYQCPMDPQVISDAEGNCPVCKMKITEVTIFQAQENLNNAEI